MPTVDLKHIVDALVAERKRIAHDEPGGNLHLCDQLSYAIEQVELTQAITDIVENPSRHLHGRSLGMAIWDLF